MHCRERPRLRRGRSSEAHPEVNIPQCYMYLPAHLVGRYLLEERKEVGGGWELVAAGRWDLEVEMWVAGWV
mgnify:CR=1 FL=1